MNCQELATAAVEKLNTKCFILNNQYLGMVMQVGWLFPCCVCSNSLVPCSLVWLARNNPRLGMAMQARRAGCLYLFGGGGGGHAGAPAAPLASCFIPRMNRSNRN